MLKLFLPLPWLTILKWYQFNVSQDTSAMLLNISAILKEIWFLLMAWISAATLVIIFCIDYVNQDFNVACSGRPAWYVIVTVIHYFSTLWNVRVAFQVQCDQLFLTDLNAGVTPPPSAVVYPDIVTVQCEPKYKGSDTEYQCNAEGDLVPLTGVPIECSASK